MGRPKRSVLATAEETSSPPIRLHSGQTIARVIKAEGNNLYSVELPDRATLLVELPSRFRSTIWIKRASYVMVDTKAFQDRDNKLDGEIANVVRKENFWRKQAYWPVEFVKRESYLEESDEDSSVVGKMPPAEESDHDQ